MKTLIGILLFMVVSIVTPVTAYADTPFEFPTVNGFFIAQVGDDHYLVVEEVLVDDDNYWAIWQFNHANFTWELSTFGQPAPGTRHPAQKAARVAIFSIR